MKIALIGLAALLPALASADDASPAPYVLHQGRAVQSDAGTASGNGTPAPQNSAPGRANGVAVRQVSNFGTAPVHTSIVGGRSSFGRSAAPAYGPRTFRGSSHRRGITGSAPTTSTPSNSAPPAYAVPGAKIISNGQPPVYSEAAGGGTHSVEGGGFIAMDQSKAHDVGRAPGITWAPPDTPPSATRTGTGGGSGASANGPAPTSTSAGSPSTAGSGGSTTSSGPGHISGTGNGGDNNNGSNGNGSSGNGNNGGDNNNFIGGGLAF